jgi:hypothetical protein
VKRILTPFEREELRMIARLQQLNIYPQLVRRLNEGQSASGVARWAMTVGVEGAPGAWGFGFWLKHTAALWRDVRAAKEKLRNQERHQRRTGLTEPIASDAVLAKVNQTLEDKGLLDFIPKEVHSVFKHVLGEEKRLRAIHLLTYAAMTQIPRVERVKELEKSMPSMLPNGHQEIKRLTEIGSELMKYELGQEMLRGKYGLMPQGSRADGDPDLPPIARTMMEFDEVDRSLIRELSVRFIEMAQEKVSGRFKAVRLEGDAGRAGTAADGNNGGDSEPHDAEGS